MRVFGVLVMFLAFSFFIAACYAAYQAPRWSGKPRLAAIRFLIFRFRPNVMVVILGGMVMLGLCALFYRSALGSSKELRIMNLGKVPEEKDVFQSLLDVATFLKEETGPFHE
eukprot:g33356.t1